MVSRTRKLKHRKKTHSSQKTVALVSFGSPKLTNALLILFCILLLGNLIMEIVDFHATESAVLISPDSYPPESSHRRRRRQDLTIYGTEFGQYPNVTWIEDNDNASVIILSAALYSRRDRKETGDMNHRTYANIHGYSYDMITKPKYQITQTKRRTPNHYQKTAHIYHHIVQQLERRDRRRRTKINDEKHEGKMKEEEEEDDDDLIDLIMWIDNDALFMNCDQTVEELYRQSHDFYAREFDRDTESGQFRDMIVTGDRGASINSGVIIVRPSEWTKQIFSDWYAYSTSWALYKKYTKSVCFDQPILHAVLNGLKPEELLLDEIKPKVGDSTPKQQGSSNLTDTPEDRARFQRACANWTQLSVEEKMSVLDSKKDMTAQWNYVWNTRSRPFDRAGCSSDQVKYAWRNLLTKESRDHTLIIPQRWMNSDWKYKNSRCNWKPGEYILHFHGVYNRWPLLKQMNVNSTCF